jgi:hypothetical protein
MRLAIHLARLSVLAAAALACGGAVAQTHDIVFDERGGAALRAQVPPGKSLDWCGRLQPGDDVHWEFESADPLEMEVHMREGSAIVQVVRAATGSTRTGRLVPAAEQPHCWTWTNRGGAPVALQARLQKSPRRPAS